MMKANLSPQQQLAEQYKERGNELFKAGNLPAAIWEFDEGLKNDPSNKFLYSNRALAYIRLMQPAQALNDADMALKLDPLFVKAWARKGSCHQLLEDYQQALNAFARGTSIEPGNKECQEGTQKTKMLIQAQNNTSIMSGRVAPTNQSMMSAQTGQIPQPQMMPTGQQSMMAQQQMMKPAPQGYSPQQTTPQQYNPYAQEMSMNQRPQWTGPQPQQNVGLQRQQSLPVNSNPQQQLQQQKPPGNGVPGQQQPMMMQQPVQEQAVPIQQPILQRQMTQQPMQFQQQPLQNFPPNQAKQQQRQMMNDSSQIGSQIESNQVSTQYDQYNRPRTDTDMMIMTGLGQAVSDEKNPYAQQQPSMIQQPGMMQANQAQGMTTSESQFNLGLYMGGINESAINPNESEHFLDAAEHQLIFGTGNIGPDRIPLDRASMCRASRAQGVKMEIPGFENGVLKNDMNQFDQYQGEFRIEKGFMSLEKIRDWSVCDPTMPKSQDHVVYTVFGWDRQGRFEIFRRFSEFYQLRELFTDRWPGLYIPPIPSKKLVGNTNQEFINERCFLLNLFIRQVARCPYLVESEEFNIFVRPASNNIKREMSYLARLSPENHLQRIQQYFSFLGGISDVAIQNQNSQITSFKIEATQMLVTLKKFKEHLDIMEGEFEQAMENENRMTSMLCQYEQNLRVQLGDAIGLSQPFNRSQKQQAAGYDYDNQNILDSSQFMVFDQLQTSIAGDEKLDDWAQLTQKMQNPFTTMRRWLKFEIIDIEAILEAIGKSMDMETRKIAKIKQKNDDMATVRKMKDGKDTFKSLFRSKEGKVNKITELTENIARAERDIECLDLLYKIVVLQLNQAAINFFKREKFGTYNHTINLYAVKQIENNSLKFELLSKLAKINKQTQLAQLNFAESGEKNNKETNRITSATAVTHLAVIQGKNQLSNMQKETVMPEVDANVPPKPSEKQDLFVGIIQGLVNDPNNTMAQIKKENVILEDLQKEIYQEIQKEEQAALMVEAEVNEPLPQMQPNKLAQTAYQKARINEKDNMLRYEITDDKEENDLREGLMATSKKDKMKDGQIISTQQANKTQIIGQLESEMI